MTRTPAPMPGITAEARILIERLGRYVTDRGAILAHARREGHRIDRQTVDEVLSAVPVQRYVGRRVLDSAAIRKAPRGIDFEPAHRSSAEMASGALLKRLNEQIELHADKWGVTFNQAKVYLANGAVPV